MGKRQTTTRMVGSMIQTKANKKFDIDLKYGQVREKQVSNIFANKKQKLKQKEIGGLKQVILHQNMNAMENLVE